ncbi:MAG: S8 family serine peptidase [Bdellovibrionaceae bacterium]|nr:S8 family serine peptidase [Pseudobdellovibrionaceae bacterium]
MKNIGLFIFIAMLALPAKATDGSIVRLQNPNEAQAYEQHYNVKLEPISKELGLYLSKPLTSARAQSLASQKLSFAAKFANTVASKSPSTIYSVPNHKVTLRGATPKTSSDPLIDQQWNMGLNSENVGINAVPSWQDFGSRSYDRSFNDIVIAVVDGGFDINHPDLLYNKWVNSREIASNGKDDDGNGYIDDINGWDISSNSGRIASADHGTHVAGIIGARGNNYRGIAGVNWRARIMYVSSGDLGDTASTMSAYAYVLQQKKIWIQSKGKKGANVVAVNSSFGIDGVQCSNSEFQVWNDMINELGKAGVLSIAATSNFEVNVDKNGDIPTSCDSPYLIAVTNSNRDGTKASGKEWDTITQPSFSNVGAGFGSNHIDIAAPGDEILSTAERTSAVGSQLYTAQSGTSFSTPHVAGAIGYLHSVASNAFNKRYLADPAAASLELKNVILNTVTLVPAMSGLTKTGGILNLHEASTAMQSQGVLMAQSNSY